MRAIGAGEQLGRQSLKQLDGLLAMLRAGQTVEEAPAGIRGCLSSEGQYRRLELTLGPLELHETHEHSFELGHIGSSQNLGLEHPKRQAATKAGAAKSGEGGQLVPLAIGLMTFIVLGEIRASEVALSNQRGRQRVQHRTILDRRELRLIVAGRRRNLVPERERVAVGLRRRSEVACARRHDAVVPSGLAAQEVLVEDAKPPFV